MNKRGFTLVELIITISLLAVIAGIFCVSFITILNNNKKREYNNAITILQSAADAYISSIIDSSDIVFEDIKEASNDSGKYTYITLDELVSTGFLSEIPYNSKTGDRFNGLIKFSKGLEGNYIYEYVEPEERYITIVYILNGADSISKHTEVIFVNDTSSKEEIVSKSNEVVLPSIIRKNGEGIGWSVEKSRTDTSYYSSTSLKNLLLDEDYSIIDNKIYIYAISSKENKLYLSVDNNTVSTTSCILYNDDSSCYVTIPLYSDITKWSNNNNTITYNTGEQIELSRDMILHSVVE